MSILNFDHFAYHALARKKKTGAPKKSMKKPGRPKDQRKVRERFELSTSGFAGPRTAGLYYLTVSIKTQNRQLTL